MLERPNREEYTNYYANYVQLVPPGSLLDILTRQQRAVLHVFAGMSEEQAGYRYAPGKWSLKELCGHLADTERIMAYRLLRVSRGDPSGLAGYDENMFVEEAACDDLPLPLLLEDYQAVRASTLTLLRTLDRRGLQRKGIANGSELSALALACIIAGHEAHHLNIIHERYRQG
ncbi:DinB family protein [Paenibacillaceae bacterium]|nr:DinB family protein [Paenibacillaceae bacterium]